MDLYVNEKIVYKQYVMQTNLGLIWKRKNEILLS